MAKSDGVISASNIGIFVDVAGTMTKVSEITSATLNLTHTPRTIKSNDSGDWVRRARGEKDWEMSGNSLFRFDAGYGFADLFALFESGATVMIRFKTYEPTAGINYDDQYEGSAIITQLQATGSTGENETYSFTFAADGDLAIYYLPLSAETNAGGTVVTLDMNMVMEDPAGLHAAFAFTADATPNVVTAVALNGDTTKLDLTLTSAVTNGAALLLNYTKPGSGSVVEGSNGIDMASFANYIVTNNVPEP